MESTKTLSEQSASAEPSEAITKKVRMELVGLNGNAFSIIGAFQLHARRQGWTGDEIQAVLKEASSGDYNHLLRTMIKHVDDGDPDYFRIGNQYVQTFTMPAGKYYIGDLCYVMHDKWDAFCEVTIQKGKVLYGKFDVEGVEVCQFGTMYGDGEYPDQFGRIYSVDAGLIGCIMVGDIVECKDNNVKLGHVVEFAEPFECYVDNDNGRLYFGHICIETGDLEDDENDYE